MTPKRKENSIPYSYNNLSSIFRFIVCQGVAYVRLKAKPEKFKLLALKVVAVDYERLQIWWFHLEIFGISKN